MNSGATADRVYDALKRRLLSGEVRPGDRLEPAALAEDLVSSVTPVRDALHRLLGEHLVETRTGEGFYCPHLTAPDLQDLYQWNEQLVLLSLRCRRRPGVTPAIMVDPAASTADRAGRLFLSIAEQSPNLEHRRAVTALNDRLYAVRTREAATMTGIGSELAELAAAIEETAPMKSAARLVTAYHRRRWRAASDIVRTVYRAA